ncbi:FG-GAP-like repeat-containing protein [Streptomyces sp. NBC_00083]|uniref:FG-GAP-like repeat-containing protein n=1 Tax=Streptomyces sp. NBC_00083 TaxID=2975647 RepID=UPI00225975C7|nr:FG-GAP-like repeat-containing protein [Streptomyces sp. NBC_00083]MCX5382004.1 FG-GAP-like repeat-containing protein [Streptomyces sp. NBC_00083]
MAQRNRSLRRAAQIATAGTASLALMTAFAGAAQADPSGTTSTPHHVSTPAWALAQGGDTLDQSLTSVSSVDADHAWAGGWKTGDKGMDGRIARWDGTTWSTVTDPALPHVMQWSAVSAVSATDVWAYGLTETDQYLVHYDGEKWTVVPTAGAYDRAWPEVPLKAVPGRLFKGGNALYTYSDGTWQTFAVPEGVDIQGIDALSANDAYATGTQFQGEGGHPVTYHWDGTTWTLMPQIPAPSGVTVSHIAAQSPKSVYAAGWGQSSALPPRPHVEHWDGTAWHDITGDLAAFVVQAIRPDGHGGLWAVGGDDATQNAAPAFWHYDGTSWTKQAGESATEPTSRSYEFTDITPVNGTAGGGLIAVGRYVVPAVNPSDLDTSRALIEQTRTSLDVTTTDLTVSSTATHTVRVHAEGAGRLTVGFRPEEGQPAWDRSAVDLKVTAVDGGPQTVCDHAAGPVNAAAEAVSCTLPAGDHTLTYTLASGAYTDAWQVETDVRFTAADENAASPKATAGFVVNSLYPVPTGSRFLGRDAQGTLWRYDGTGDASAPYRGRVAVSDGWQGYTAITALSGLTVHGAGDVVARDASGVLWYYRGGGDTVPFAARTKVGAGWNMYDALTGAGDLTGDGRADLVARDTAGVLWLYQGTASASAPFAPRVRIGAGWDAYTVLTGKGDLTGDGRADLLARDASGVLWLYQGTGNAAAPYAPRAKVGTDWNLYNALLVPGDLTGDGRADILGRDASGVLWLYKGTGNAAAPYAPRAKVGTNWSLYNGLI